MKYGKSYAVNERYFCTDHELMAFLESQNDPDGRFMARLIWDRCPDADGLVEFDDFHQEALMTISHSLVMFDELRVDVKQSTYVYTAVENCLKMMVRAALASARGHGRNVCTTTEWMRQEAAERPIRDVRAAEMTHDEEASVLDRLEYEEQFRLLWNLAEQAQLSAEEKQVVGWTLQGIPQAEMGRRLGCSQPTISKIKRLACEKILAAKAAA